MKRFLLVLMVMVMVPYVTTLAWTGRLDSEEFLWDKGGEDGEPVVIVEQNGNELPVSVEDFLVGVVANQIPADYGEETIKAQAILARTYLYRELDGAGSIREEALDIDCLNRAQMEGLWGSGRFASCYQKIQGAIEATAGQALLSDGTLVEPFFCRAAAGKTRSGDEKHPYLKAVESAGDLEADGFLNMTLWTAEQMASRINEIPDGVAVSPSQLPGEIQIVERDESGYVRQIQVGAKTYSGEEIQYALNLPSACYSFEELDGEIRVVSKGIGHGFGFSQAGANALEKEGNDVQALLNYYFYHVEVKQIYSE